MLTFLLPSILLSTLAYSTPLLYDGAPLLFDRSDSSRPVFTSSFTWNDNCGSTVACGSAMAGVKGMGYTAANNMTFADGKPVVYGKSAGCGQCWHLQALADPFPQNGNSWGTPVVAMINDQCTDGGYCDQTPEHPLNTGYGKQVHFDLCVETGTADQFFKTRSAFGVLTGVAQQVDCSLMKNGPQGSGAGNIQGGPSSGGSSSSAAAGQSATSSAATVASTVSPWGNNGTSSQQGGSQGSGQGSGQGSVQGTGQGSEQGSSSGGASSGGSSSGGSSSGGSSSGGSSSGGASSGGSSSGDSSSGDSSSGGSSSGGTSSSGGSQSNPQAQPPPQEEQSTPSSSSDGPSSSSAAQAGTGSSHGSMQGLEDAAFKGASGGVQGMIDAMKTYMEEALAGDAPDDDGEEDGDCDEL